MTFTVSKILMVIAGILFVLAIFSVPFPALQMMAAGLAFMAFAAVVP